MGWLVGWFGRRRWQAGGGGRLEAAEGLGEGPAARESSSGVIGT